MDGSHILAFVAGWVLCIVRDRWVRRWRRSRLERDAERLGRVRR